MVTLAKLCLVMTVVLGLAFASPRPTGSRNQDTGDKVSAGAQGVQDPDTDTDLDDRAPKLKCPEKDFNIIGHDIKMHPDVKTWSDCDHMCIMLEKTCEYWTWDEKGEKCFLKSDYTGGIDYDRMFSGKRGCHST